LKHTNRSVGPLALACGAFAVLSGPACAGSMEAALDEIDRTFVCPEDLPNDDAREASLRQFLERIRKDAGTMTVDQMIEFRVRLLEKHHCTKTLQHIRQNDG